MVLCGDRLDVQHRVLQVIIVGASTFAFDNDVICRSQQTPTQSKGVAVEPRLLSRWTRSLWPDIMADCIRHLSCFVFCIGVYVWKPLGETLWFLAGTLGNSTPCRGKPVCRGCKRTQVHETVSSDISLRMLVPAPCELI